MARRYAPLVIAAATLLAALPIVRAQRVSGPVGRAAGAATAPKIIVEKNLEARMRDGVILRADIYRPDTPERLPALVERTPYSKNPGQDDSQFRRLAAHGYVVVVQDTRGRHMSDGIARPHDEGEDGYDTIAWVGTLPSVNGRVATFGGSYSATTQLMAAPLRPPKLLAMFPSSSYHSRYDMVFQGGAFYLADGLSWNLGQGADVRRRTLHPDIVRDGPIGMDEGERQLFASSWLWHVPLKTVDAMELRRFSPAYFEMLSHPSYDGYWKTFDIEARHAEIDVPAYHVTGWYDTLLTGTLRNYTGLRRHARSDRSRSAQRLLVGPWTHSRPTTASTKIGDVDFGPDAGFPLESLMFDFAAGHRIRVEISSSNFPRFDRNPNTGTPFGESAELRRAEQTIFHDRERPSRIVLPVVY